MIIPLPQQVNRVELFLRSIPENPVYSWGVLALVFRHSSYSKGFAAKRVGQETLQGFHLAPSLFLRCLDDPTLKPTHVLADGSPIDGVPVGYSVEGCTSSVF